MRGNANSARWGSIVKPILRLVTSCENSRYRYCFLRYDHSSLWFHRLSCIVVGFRSFSIPRLLQTGGERRIVSVKRRGRDSWEAQLEKICKVKERCSAISELIIENERKKYIYVDVSRKKVNIHRREFSSENEIANDLRNECASTMQILLARLEYILEKNAKRYKSFFN